MRHVYLAGPIQGCTYGEANDWRKGVAAELAEHGIVGISPLRCEPIIGEIYKTGYEDPRFGTARAIGSKNKFDVKACDLVLVYLPNPANFPHMKHQSYGTIVELGWANALHTPTIVVSDDPAILNHPVISSAAGWILNDLKPAVETIIGVLGGYDGVGKNV